MAHTMAVKCVLEIVILKHPKADAMPYTLDVYTVHIKCYFEAGFKHQMYYYKNQKSGEVADIWEKKIKLLHLLNF